jgi:hypothetical protein
MPANENFKNVLSTDPLKNLSVHEMKRKVLAVL